MHLLCIITCSRNHKSKARPLPYQTAAYLVRLCHLFLCHHFCREADRPAAPAGSSRHSSANKGHQPMNNMADVALEAMRRLNGGALARSTHSISEANEPNEKGGHDNNAAISSEAGQCRSSTCHGQGAAGTASGTSSARTSLDLEGSSTSAYSSHRSSIELQSYLGSGTSSPSRLSLDRGPGTGKGPLGGCLCYDA